MSDYNIRPIAHFSKTSVKKSRILPESLNLNGNIFFKLLLTELLKKTGLSELQKPKNKNRAEQADNKFSLEGEMEVMQSFGKFFNFIIWRCWVKPSFLEQ